VCATAKQAIPYGVDSSKPYANEVVAKLKKYYVKMGRQGQPHAGHERLFDWLEHLLQASTQQQQVAGQQDLPPQQQLQQGQQQQERPQAPLIVLGCGKEYWYARAAKQPAFMAAGIEAQRQDGVRRVVMRRPGAPNQGWKLTEKCYAAEDLQEIQRVVTAALAEVQRAGPLPAAAIPAAALAADPAACNGLPPAAAAAAAPPPGLAAAGAVTGTALIGQAAAVLAAVAPASAGGETTTGAVAGTATAVGVPAAAAAAAAAAGAESGGLRPSSSGATESVATAEGLDEVLQEEVQHASSSKQQAGCKRPLHQQEQQRRQRLASSLCQQAPQLQQNQAEERTQPHQQQQQQRQASSTVTQAPLPRQVQLQEQPVAPLAPGQQEQQQQQQLLPGQIQQQQQQWSPAAATAAAAAAAANMLPEGYALEDFSSVPAVLAQLPGLLRHLGAPVDLRASLQTALMLQIAVGNGQQQPQEDGSRLALLGGQYGLLQLCVEQQDADMTRSSLDGLLTMMGA
jgi:hypothetical protein